MPSALLLLLLLLALHGAAAAPAVSFDTGRPPAGRAMPLPGPPSSRTVDVFGAVAQEKLCCGHAGKDCPGHVPDVPARAFKDRRAGRIRMIVGSTAYYPMSGPSPLNQSRSCVASFNKTADPNPADFAADEYLDSPYSFGNGTVVSLVHTEFPGNRYNACTTTSYPHCWTVSIGLFVSHDWGQTFAHARPPPHHLVAAVPAVYDQSQLASGWGDPSNILKHPTDGHWYALIWNRNRVGAQMPGLCLMRTSSLLDPTAWRAWGGPANGFSVAFADPYTDDGHDDAAGGEAPSQRHVCTVTNLPAGNIEDGCAAHGLFWSAYLHKFVVTLGCDQGRTAVFRWATSDDLITWSDAKVLMNQTLARQTSRDVVRGMNYPTFIDVDYNHYNHDADQGDDNFGVIGQHPYLFFVSIGDNPEDIGRHLLAVPFAFEKAT